MAKKKSNKSLWVMLALIAVIIAVILLLPGCGSRNARKSAETKTEATTLVGAGETAPGFTVELTDGSRLSLEELRGKVVLLNFWATWCPPCREEIPELISIRKAYPADKVVIVGISLDSDRGKLESFAEAMNFNYPVYLAEPDVPALFGISSIPFNLLYDKTGKLVAGGPGMVGKEDLEEAFSGLLN